MEVAPNSKYCKKFNQIKDTTNEKPILQIKRFIGKWMDPLMVTLSPEVVPLHRVELPLPPFSVLLLPPLQAVFE